MVRTDQVLVQPIVTEKTMAETNKFAFLVSDNATKADVKKAVLDFYGQEVLKVNIVNLPGKERYIRRGVTASKRRPYKKALVTLKPGEKIEFNAFK